MARKTTEEVYADIKRKCDTARTSHDVKEWVERTYGEEAWMLLSEEGRLEAVEHYEQYKKGVNIEMGSHCFTELYQLARDGKIIMHVGQGYLVMVDLIDY